MHACLSTEVGDELTLNEFTRQVKEGAKAGAAAEAPTPDTSPVRRGGGGGGGAGASLGRAAAAAASKNNDEALARVARLVDGSAGTLKRRFHKGGANGAFSLSPEELSATLAAASFDPRDVRFVLAELRVWEGYPNRMRFARFRALLRPREVRSKERKAKRAAAGEAARAAAEEDIAAGRAVKVPAVKPPGE